MAAYTIEQRAETVAEFLLTGSITHAARFLGAQRKTVRAWVRAADDPLNDHEKDIAERALVIVKAKRASLDDIYGRAVELQLRDLPEADFRDRTGLLKIVHEMRLLRDGKPTSITKSIDQMDQEIERMTAELAARDGDRAD
jgi:hypothetical protein